MGWRDGAKALLVQYLTLATSSSDLAFREAENLLASQASAENSLPVLCQALPALRRHVMSSSASAWQAAQSVPSSLNVSWHASAEFSGKKVVSTIAGWPGGRDIKQWFLPSLHGACPASHWLLGLSPARRECSAAWSATAPHLPEAVKTTFIALFCISETRLQHHWPPCHGALPWEAWLHLWISLASWRERGVPGGNSQAPVDSQMGLDAITISKASVFQQEGFPAACK